jgi:hypothetical protein
VLAPFIDDFGTWYQAGDFYPLYVGVKEIDEGKISLPSDGQE